MIDKQMKLVSILGMILFVTACGESGSNQSDQSTATDSTFKALQELEAETMAIHDSIMPQMDSLVTLKKQLEQQLKKDRTAKNKQVIENQVDSLEAAKEKMMSWMSRYTKNYKRGPDSVAIDRKAAKLDSLHHDVRNLKKFWDQTLERSSEFVK